MNVPIIGIVKRDLEDSPVRITPFIEDAEALADAGADVVAFDATDRFGQHPSTHWFRPQGGGKLTMADCASLERMRNALWRPVSISS